MIISSYASHHSVVGRFQLWVKNMRINLRSLDILVPQHTRNRHQINALMEQVGRERVAQSMWMNIFEMRVFADITEHMSHSVGAEALVGFGGDK